MIKITQDNATLPISENKNLINYLNDADISWDLNNEYASIGSISDSLVRLFENQYIKDATKSILAVLPAKAFGDFLGEMAVLRKYDSSRTSSTEFKVENGATIYIVPSSKISNAFILCMSDLNIVPEKTTININDLIIESNKDLSKVELNVIGSVKLINIRMD